MEVKVAETIYEDDIEDIGPEIDRELLGLDEPEMNFSEEDIEFILGSLTPEEREEFDALVLSANNRVKLPHQVVPWKELWWEVMVLVGGRGVGKTFTGTEACIEHLNEEGRDARIGIGAPTSSDARDVCLEGPAGLITSYPHEFTKYNRSLGEARHIKGGLVKAMGTEKPERWNGPQWSFLWFDELSLCNQKSWDDANLATRLGEFPRALGTCTPKNRKWVKKLCQDKTTYVPQYIDNETGKKRLPTTFDNPNLPARKVQWLKNKYAGSRLGRQELYGEFIDDVAGAIWQREIIQHVDTLPKFKRITLAIDPAGSPARRKADANSLSEDQKQNQEKNAETAITVIGLGLDDNLYVIASKSGSWKASEWGAIAIYMYHRYRCDKIVAEKNFGGEMVESTMRQILTNSRAIKDLLRAVGYPPKTDKFGKELPPITLNGRFLPIKLVWASDSKVIRATPIVTLYEQGRVYHYNYLGDLEDQMCHFVDTDDNDGADMVDSLVWAATDLIGLGLPLQGTTQTLPGDRRITALVIM